MSSVIRTIQRQTARAKMEKAGKTQINKKKYDAATDKTYSFFSRNWRAFAE